MPEKRRTKLRELLGALEEARDDFVRGAKRLKNAVFPSVDVIVRRRGSDLTPTASAFRHWVHRVTPAPAQVEESEDRLVLRLRRFAHLSDLLRCHALGHHVRPRDIQLVPAPVVPK